jgi:HlyD family secretion protein
MSLAAVRRSALDQCRERDDSGKRRLMVDQLQIKPQARQGAAPLPASVRTGVRRRRLVGALIAVIVVGAAVAWWRLPGAAAVRYETVPMTRGAVTRTVNATGTVNPELTIIVGSYVSGVIQALYCDYNSRVKAGQICAKIDPRPYQSVVSQDQANLAVAKAQLEKDRANLAYTKLSYDRNRWLVEHKSVSQDAADLAKNAYDQAQAQLGLDQAAIDQRQAELEASQINLGYTDIVSPVDGTVVSRNVTMGQTVAASFQTPTLFLIATDLTKMQVDTNVSESDIGGIKQGDKVSFTVDAFPKRQFDGTVTQVRQAPQTVQNVVTFDVVASADNRDLVLMPGMTASARIIVDQRNDVLRVPNAALRYLPGGLINPPTPGTTPPAPAAEGSRVWVLRDSEPVSVPVVPGLDDDAFTEIVSSDLHADDRIIVAEERGNDGGSKLPLPRF